MEDPAGAQVAPGVADLARRRASPGRAEEDDVSRLELREADALRLRHLAAHLVGRASFDRRVERRAAGIGLKLVDAPDEPRAVETAASLDAERRLGVLARAAPDVGIADEAGGGVEYAHLPRAEVGERECRGSVLDVLLLPTAEMQDGRDGVRRFGPRDGIRGE